MWLANRGRNGANALALFEYGIAVLVIVVFISMYVVVILSLPGKFFRLLFLHILRFILVGRISPPAGDVFLYVQLSQPWPFQDLTFLCNSGFVPSSTIVKPEALV